MQILWKKPTEDYSKAELFPLRVTRVFNNNLAIHVDCINEQLSGFETYKHSTLVKQAKQNEKGSTDVCLIYVNPVTHELLEQVYTIYNTEIITGSNELSFAAGSVPIITLTYYI